MVYFVKMSISFCSFIESLFLLFVLVILWLFSRAIYLYFIRKELDLPQRYGKGTWAVITGGSEGIGRGIAFSLAKRGFKIYLLARSEKKLKESMEMIQKAFPGTEVRYMSIDFSVVNNPQAYKEKIAKHFEDYDVSILVNNVGTASIDYFHSDALETADFITSLNINCITMMSKIFIRKFLAREKRSAFINLSSLMCLSPASLSGFMYNSSKVYDDYFSRGLHLLYNFKMDSMSVRPGMFLILRV